jgi:competence protein ComEC
MTIKLLPARLLVLVFMSVVCVVVWTASPALSTHQQLQVTFLDVGQGDSIHIRTPDNFEVLIDGGMSSAVLRELAEGRSFFDRHLDLVIATHPDADHVGGLADVLERYQVDRVLMVEVDHDTPAAESFARAVTNETGVDVWHAHAGQIITIGASTSLKILSPRGDTTNWNSNNASIISQLSYGDIDFMLTGDAPASIENFLVEYYGSALESEVLKLGHHGSKTSTSEEFLAAVAPTFAVVSAGKDNRYGHPAVEVVRRVEDFGADIVSTSESGRITFVTDGTSVWRE